MLSASGILAALRTWWVRAITTPFVQLFVEPRDCDRLAGERRDGDAGGLVDDSQHDPRAADRAVAWTSGIVRSRRAAEEVARHVGLGAVGLAVVVAIVGANADGMARRERSLEAERCCLIALLLLVRFRLFERMSQRDRSYDRSERSPRKALREVPAAAR